LKPHSFLAATVGGPIPNGVESASPWKANRRLHSVLRTTWGLRSFHLAGQAFSTCPVSLDHCGVDVTRIHVVHLHCVSSGAVVTSQGVFFGNRIRHNGT